MASGGAAAQSCERNFTSQGVPLLTALTYRAWQAFPKTTPKRALDNLARAVAVEGFDNIRVDRALGAISATQEVTGSGREQTLRVVVRKEAAGSRVDAVFAVKPGQVAPEGATRDAMCRMISAAPR
ncbi:hypothetical protein JOD31_000557 [Methylopila capsulata]|uniref:Uncharacterized protein n=1 Tax=Methylopila capsulata TaxID=61654 RepID=A0ABS2T4M3_9HYPH|nr:hypothetical protein [Methylopila capsulata]MBM7850345.1 hypothetical protein [Methylopila capsulata]